MHAIAKIILGIYYFFSTCYIFSQNSNFISSHSSNFVLNNQPFFFSGTNAYYSQSLIAYNDTNSLNEVFASAKALGMKVVRIWGFYDKDNNGDPAIIQYSPGKYNEYALTALDLVLQKAAEFNLRIIICLVNNWEDYGGMNQYVEWLSKTLTFCKNNSTSKNYL